MNANIEENIHLVNLLKRLSVTSEFRIRTVSKDMETNHSEKMNKRYLNKPFQLPVFSKFLISQRVCIYLFRISIFKQVSVPLRWGGGGGG